MKGKPKEWAVAFHGVRNPMGEINNQGKVLNLIMKGFKSDDGITLKKGDNQAK